jgi:DEAD/DEAH box helicase domain-containing protein
MIPWVVARELRETLLDYLKSTWSIADRPLERALFAFLNGPRGIFQGPYLRIALPFAPTPAGAPLPLDITPPYAPHQHQLEAWQRLSSRGQEPRATLVTTGTGSGKTECFLYPVLDHALREVRAGRPGIKAIVLYPMNALASDQASRFAHIIDADPRLRGHLRVGLFVGGEGSHRTMGRDHVIDRNDVLRDAPPDVLLTNYRMLDLLLQRPKDARLWAKNGPETLRYLVLDELHTYDGAQGTDVACLLRRLGKRLGNPDRICPVGTSATVGSRDSTRAELLRFASTLFDQTFEEDAFVGETRLPAEALFHEEAFAEVYPAAPGPFPEPGVRVEPYVTEVVRAWFGGQAAWAQEARTAILPRAPEGPRLDRVALGRFVRRVPLARALCRLASARPLALEELLRAASAELPVFRDLSRAEQEGFVASALSMLSYAERQVGEHTLPLVGVQTTLWVREVRRLLTRVTAADEAPTFRFLDDSPPPAGETWLPRYACRDCGQGGWLAVESGLGAELVTNYRAVARAYQERSADLRLLHHLHHRAGDAGEEADAAEGAQRAFFEPTRRVLGRSEGPGTFPISVSGEGREAGKKLVCPSCAADDSLYLLAARSATLSSVAIGHLFTTPLNTDRKLLTFSDSVQDAAHRAGFFGARTYRFAVRSALLAALPEEGTLPLASLAAATWEHWTARLGRPGLGAETELTALLLPLDLHFLASAEDFHERLAEHVQERREAESAGEAAPALVPAPSPQLLADLRARLGWEATRELGLATRIGRTLEQSGCVSVTVDAARFDAAVAELHSLLRERLALTVDMGEAALAAFAAGLFTRMRLRGAVFDALLEPYVRSGGADYFLSKERAPLLSPFGRDTSRPLLLTNARKPKNFDGIDSPHRTWLADWVGRSLGLSAPGDAAEVLRAALPLFTKRGLLIATATDETGPLAGSKATAWSLDPGALQVGRAHALRRCAVCGFELSALTGSRLDLAGHPCLRFRCAGRLAEVVAQQDEGGLPVASYYRRFYERGELGRLFSKEHTGLLGREERDNLELEFRERPRPDSPNLLSCTPTLEMGIDVGDLSATLLCSVPPSPASYVQRVGRAGRRTGNAMILAFATTRPHDLYFFEDPLAAMAGVIEPPGCYLSAPEVLKRQAVAFAFDGYARTGGTLPARVTEALHGDEAKRFPAALLGFIAPRRAALGAAFVEMFEGALSDSARETARGLFAPDADGRSPVEGMLVRVTQEARARRDELRALLRRIDDRRSELADEEAAKKTGISLEEERSRFAGEKAFVYAKLHALIERDLFGWLSEEGCLPNYAFPERGVKLDAYIGREGTNRGPEHHGWVRPPAAALRELAPFNTFYASARRVRIDGVELKKNATDVADWILCGVCQHAELALKGGSAAAECPLCGDPRWLDVGQRHRLVPLTEVFALSTHRDAALGDDSDDRERAYYDILRLYEPEGPAREAWANDGAGFGFELLPRLVLREVNLGVRDDRDTAPKAQIAGKSVTDAPFVLCKSCGMARTPEGRAPGREPHRAWCAERKKAVASQQTLGVHLLRELRSEAVRLVVPVVAGLSVDTDMANLRGLLRLGLRRFYGGEPDFLDVRAYDEPLKAGEGRRRCLVILDVVPGGTGLLAELALGRGEKLRVALEKGREALRACPCAARVPAARACYQCLYAYREGDELPLLDRVHALGLAERLLSAWDGLVKVDGIGGMAQSTLLESELEHQFVEALEKRLQAEGGAFEERGDGDYLVRVGARRWHVRAQVALGKDRVEFPCEADFLFSPETPSPGVRDVAVFTDGFVWHVNPGQPRGTLQDDCRKRGQMAGSDRLLAWSLTWKDLLPGYANLPSWFSEAVAAKSVRALAQALDRSAKAPALASEETLESLLPLLDADPLRALVAYLGAPTRLEAFAGLVMASLLKDGKNEPREALRSAHDRLRSEEQPVFPPLLGPGGTRKAAELGLGEHARALLDVDTAALGKLHTSLGSVEVTLRVEDDAERRRAGSFEASWRRLLHAWNLLQAVPGAALVSREGLFRDEAAGPSAAAPLLVAPPVVSAASVVLAGQPEAHVVHLAELRDEGVRGVLAALLAKHPGLELPAIPFEHRSPGFRMDDDVELGWPTRRVAAFFEGQRAAAEQLRGAGFQVLELDRRLTVADFERALGLADKD